MRHRTKSGWRNCIIRSKVSKHPSIESIFDQKLDPKNVFTDTLDILDKVLEVELRNSWYVRRSVCWASVRFSCLHAGSALQMPCTRFQTQAEWYASTVISKQRYLRPNCSHSLSHLRGMNESEHKWPAFLPYQILHDDDVTLMMEVCSVPLSLSESGGPYPFIFVVSEGLIDIIP